MSDKLQGLEVQAKKILAKYDRKHAAVLPLLHLGQDTLGKVTPELEAWVAKWTEVPIVHVHEVVSFYTLFHREELGKHHIRFCTTTSCTLMGSEGKLKYLKEKLKITNGRSADGKVSLEEVECLCACEDAPMMQVNDDYHGPLTDKSIDKIIADLK